jgi:DNA polymerase V
MVGAGIFPGDIAIIGRSRVEPEIKAIHNKIVLAVLDGEFTIKRLCVRGSAVSLVPENENYQPIAVSEGRDFTIWGMVKHSIRHF